MGLSGAGRRGKAKRLEQELESALNSFTLLSGERYFYPTGPGLYLWCYHCLEAGHPDEWPEPPAPEVLLKILEAEDVEAALEQVLTPAVADILPFDPEIIVSERRLEPRSLVEGRSVYDEALDDLSEGFDIAEGGL